MSEFKHMIKNEVRQTDRPICYYFKWKGKLQYKMQQTWNDDESCFKHGARPKTLIWGALVIYSK